ncbi:3-methylitaconate isomerase [Cladophialophora carrionii]|uniref:3-methylitaconate isomerase n=1 Tax=Cladophialophora carrionii TaxID=86049 RepID=A0A1C1D2X0_9EURO|nr:3-methylitaconate isomerase [Cladophialophora carrionii]
MRQHRLPAAYYRGGTSRAVFFQPKDLPAERTQWAPIFLGVLGSPDVWGRQLDGMGGGISSLSKICVVGPSSHPDADVDYTFAAVGVKDAEVDFSSNCGNMTSAVGPFAVDAKIFNPVQVDGDANPGGPEIMTKAETETEREADSKAVVTVTVRIHNTNTGKIIHSTFDVQDGEAVASGAFSIDGVGGSGARIQLDFVNPAGSKTGKLLPTGSVVDTFDGVNATCIDVGNPCCFVQAASLDVDGAISPAEIEAHPTLLARLDSIRRQAGVKMGLAPTRADVPGSVPKICLVSRPGEDNAEMDLRVRAISVGQPHKAVPITVALACAAASKLAGSTVQECCSEHPVDSAGVTLGHSSGRLMVGAQYDEDGELRSATVFRTARRLMEGFVYWK